MKNILKIFVLCACTFAFSVQGFSQDVLGTSYLKNANAPIYESVVVVGLVDDGANLDYGTFTSDLSNKAVNIGMLEQLKRVEAERMIAPYSGVRIESIILNNRRIVMNPEKKSALIFYYHPDPTLAQRLANLFAREFVAYCQSLNAQDLTTELQKYEKIKIPLDNKINEVSQALTRFYENSSNSTATPPQAKQLDMLMAQKEKLMNLINDTKQKIRQTPSGVKILRSATSPRKPKNKN